MQPAGDQIVDHGLCDIFLGNALKAFPCRNAVYFEDLQATVAVSDDVDTGIVHIERMDSVSRKSNEWFFELGTFTKCSLRHVVDPGSAMALHRRDRTPSDDQNAPVLPTARTVCRTNITLEVPDATDRISGRNVISGRDPDQSNALRAEERL